MESFIVLGLIPGTHFQINFLAWIIGFILVFDALLLWRLVQTKLAQTWFLAVFIYWEVTAHRRAQLLFDYSKFSIL